MIFYINNIKWFLTMIMVSVSSLFFAQEVVPILSSEIGSNGQIELKIDSRDDYYYLLKAKPDLSVAYESITSMTMGTGEPIILSESLGHLSQEHYEVIGIPAESPLDSDGDGMDDIVEFQNRPDYNPLNSAKKIDSTDGVVLLEDLATFKEIAILKEEVQWSEHLNGKRYAKFIIVDYLTEHPSVYFINTKKYGLHLHFSNAVGIEALGENIRKGEIVYHPTSLSDNGTLGTYTFSYSNGEPEPFIDVLKCHELLAKNMTLLKNNLSYYLTTKSEEAYEAEKSLFTASRIPLLFEADVYAEVDYWALSQSEGYGFFKLLEEGEIAGPRDIILTETTPNGLPRVGGIMSSVIQSPLSHVNLRAIQDMIPNAFIRDPLELDSIAELIDHYIYFKVEQNNYLIREASVEEVNNWYEDIRPSEEQIPELDLSYDEILPLVEIDFDMSDAFGAKCANIATMRTFGFPEGTIPDGYGVPFYFYQEFMKYNGFFDEAMAMISEQEFIDDRNYRIDKLKAFRDDIKDADMPQWMLEQLQEMHQSFPEGTSVRCRSSTNNEDLPGFSGAGLYDSKTQHPDEGHISKSIKQVYASLWNLEAYDEREFFRVNHFVASMGVLCHPNYSEEKANGVGVSQDPLYQTENTFYLNTQVGEDLITNPDANSVAEELLLDEDPFSDDKYILLRRSNLVSADSLIMNVEYLDQIRDFLSIIHDRFEEYYKAEGETSFAMEIEYKITAEAQLIIKQARPWVSFIRNIETPIIPIDIDKDLLLIYPNPTYMDIQIYCSDCMVSKVFFYNADGRLVHEESINVQPGSFDTASIEYLVKGIYYMIIMDPEGDIVAAEKVVKL